MTTLSPQPVTRRFDTIDLLRGLSILSVVLLHAHNRFSELGADASSGLPGWLSTLLFYSGGGGVQTFFAISGFLITLTSIRRFGSLAKIAPGTFYRIRFGRIAPALLLTLVVLCALDRCKVPQFVINPHQVSLPRVVLAVLTFHVNWLQATRGWLPGPWVILWSLSVEEMFYLFFPLVSITLLRWRAGLLVIVAVLAELIVHPYLLAWPLGPTNAIWNLESYLGGMRNILIGCLFALAADAYQRRGNVPNRASILALQIAGALTLLFAELPSLLPSPPLLAIGTWMDLTVSAPLLVAVGAGLIMVASLLRPTTGRAWTAPVRWLGRSSYEVYLTHQFVVILASMLYMRVHVGQGAAWLFVIVALSSLLGFLLSHFFSEPMNRLLRGALPPRAS